MSTRVRGVQRAPIDGRIAERRARVQRSLRRRRRARAAFVLATVALVAATAVAIRSPLAAVTALQVEAVGNSRGSSLDSSLGNRLDDDRRAQVQATVPDVVGTPLGQLDVTGVRARVEALAWVASADVQRELPPRVRVVVTPRQAVAKLRAGDGHWLVDAEGVVLAGAAPADLPQIVVSATEPPPRLGQPAPPEVRTAVAVARALPADLEARLDHAEARGRRDVRLVLAIEAGTVEVAFGDTRLAHNKAVAMRLLLARVPTLDLAGATLDVRAPSTPVLVPRGESKTAG